MYIYLIQNTQAVKNVVAKTNAQVKSWKSKWVGGQGHLLLMEIILTIRV